ncbi:TPA: GTPase HflX [Candidatus Dependentiae bacterium]|nr:MAG: GTPase HflX [candidate division TM6 bacterium GW2011_GWF2_33_332]HBS48102.1 GTPase HflX [Candidatus Dependentiae bacterium]HBZ73526.1 GTPase HflX [Candidatus Dependentiae bacterium]
MAKKSISIEDIRPKILLLGIYTPQNKFRDMEAYFEEFVSLVETLGAVYDEKLFIKLRNIDPSYFLTTGKIEEVTAFCEEHKIDEIICSESLSALQERNLTDAFGCVISDRARLILEIFKNSAHSAEGKTQVEIAELEYLKTRMSGRGIDMAQQAGFIGSRGPGETVKEAIRRTYATKIRQAQKRLHILEKSRDEQRKRRLQSNIPLVSLIGYTNSGKSSILNRLTKSNVLVENKLFATLDTTTKIYYPSPQKKILLSDTVGFISELPHHLIESFKSTLDELKYSDLLLIVVDISNNIWKDQIEVVRDTLHSLKIEKPYIFVFNKIDKIANIEEIKPDLEEFKPYILTSVKPKDGLNDLVTYLKDFEFKK